MGNFQSLSKKIGTNKDDGKNKFQNSQVLSSTASGSGKSVESGIKGAGLLGVIERVSVGAGVETTVEITVDSEGACLTRVESDWLVSLFGFRGSTGKAVVWVVSVGVLSFSAIAGE